MIQPLTDRALEEKVVNLVIRARQEYEIPERCYARLACEKVGLTRVFEQLPADQVGMLTENGHVVVNTMLGNISRIEYTIFHEIVHYLIEEDELYDYLNEIHHDDEKSFEATLERWCEVGAAEFMMPRARVRTLIAEHGFSINLIHRIEDINCASTEAAAIQLAVCAPIDCYVVLCTYGPTPMWPNSPALYVERAKKRDDGEFPLARGTTIPPDHLFYQVWKSKQPLSGPSWVPFRSGKTFPCEHAEAKMIGNRVAGLLCLDRPPHKDQLGLDLFD